MAAAGSSSLSICLIVKNEAEMLPQCLESIRGLGDELIVLDTGSTDATVAIARSFGAVVHHFEWCHDFAAARNESIRHASGDWILWLDADERLDPASRSELLSLLKREKKPVLYRIRIRNLKEDGVNYSLSDAHRLFTHGRGLSFSGKIHEQISPSARKVGAEERWSTVMLDHLGYSFSDERKTRKQKRNRVLLLQQLQEDPDNAYAHFTLAHNYKVDGDLISARKHYAEALRLRQFDPAMEASLLNAYADTLLDLGENEAVADLINRSLGLKSRQIAAHFLAYRLAHSSGDKARAIQALEQVKALQPQIRKQGTALSTDIDIAESRIAYTLGDLYSSQERWGEAAEAYGLALSQGPETSEGLNRYFKVLEQLMDWDAALDVLGRLIKLNGEQPTYLHALGMILLRRSDFNEALAVYLRLNDLQPGVPEVRRKIAAIYAKLGNLEEAEAWLS